MLSKNEIAWDIIHMKTWILISLKASLHSGHKKGEIPDTFAGDPYSAAPAVDKKRISFIGDR